MTEQGYSHYDNNQKVSQRVDDSQGYSPIQNRYGIVSPEDIAVFPIQDRVDQNPNPFAQSTLDQNRVLRVTYQKDDLCNLRCPGCYIGPWLEKDGSQRRKNSGSSTSTEVLLEQVKALPYLQDFFYIGAEPTLNPNETAEILASVADGLGIPTMSITNGQGDEGRNRAAFEEAVKSGNMYKLNISLDSIVPEINDFLRGRDGAFEKTLNTIRLALENEWPLKVQLTIWQSNYESVMPTVEKLYAMGVRGFAFHSGSIESIEDSIDRGIKPVDPLAWRALCSKLAEFMCEKDDLVHFNFPILYFNEEEMKTLVIGEQYSEEYFEHVQRIEDGDIVPLPIKACPAYGSPTNPGPPQVYVYANDNQQVSICQIETGGSGKKYAQWNPETKAFDIVPGENNQMQHMLQSPHLCPSTPKVHPDKHSDRVPTQGGDLYITCRYFGNSQFPVKHEQYSQYYEDFVVEYNSIPR